MNIAIELENQKREQRRRYLQILATADNAGAKTLAELDLLRSSLGYTATQVQTDLNAIHELQRLGQIVSGGSNTEEARQDADAADRAEAAVTAGIAEFKRFNAEWKQKQTARIQAAHSAQYKAKDNGRIFREARRQLDDATKAHPELAEIVLKENQPRNAA